MYWIFQNIEFAIPNTYIKYIVLSDIYVLIEILWDKTICTPYFETFVKKESYNLGDEFSKKELETKA